MHTLNTKAHTDENSVPRLAQRFLAERLDRLCHFEALAREGDDPEGVHRMRVATRRIRAVLPIIDRALADAGSGRFERDFRWVGAALGRVRDLDVLLGGLEENSGGQRSFLAFMRMSREQKADAHAELLAVLDDERYPALKRDFGSLIDRLPVAGQSLPTDRCLRDIARDETVTIRGLCARALESGRDKDLHRLRIRLRKFRYACEMFAPAYPETLPPLVETFREEQGHLGRFHDACVARKAIRRYLKFSDRGNKPLRKLARTHSRERNQSRESLLSGDVPRLLAMLRPELVAENFASTG